MKTSILTVAAVLCILSSHVSAQASRDLLLKAQEIKLLESTRDDVRRILVDFHPDDYDDHSQWYRNHLGTIRVSFSEGTCDEDAEEENETLIWEVGEWKVTRIEIEPDEPVTIDKLGFDLSKFKKEQTYYGVQDEHTYHSKTHGKAIKTNTGGIDTIVFFPPKSQAKKLCDGSRKARDFYSRISWFDKKLKDRRGCDWKDAPANVTELALSVTELEATAGKTILVTTNAFDPENDVLTYTYKVPAGRIIGSGASVTLGFDGRQGRYLHNLCRRR